VGKRLSAEPVGPEQDRLPLVVEVLAEEVEFGAIRIGSVRMRASLQPGTPLTSSPSAVPRSPGQVGEPTSLVSGRCHPCRARQPEANVAV
jgi:hypothetical protein